MMIKWTDLEAQQEHVKDLLHEAEAERLAQQLSQPRRSNWYAALLIDVGQWLVDFGCSLQARTDRALRLVSQPPAVDSGCGCPEPGRN
jgi:hypothetical protein